jgi:hypothetical protein
MSDESLDYLNELILYASRLQNIENIIDNQDKIDEMDTMSFYLGYNQETSSAIVQKSGEVTVSKIKNRGGNGRSAGNKTGSITPGQPTPSRKEIIPPKRKPPITQKEQEKPTEIIYHTGVLFKVSYERDQPIECTNPTYSYESGQAVQKCDGTGEYSTYQELKNNHYTYQFTKSVKGYDANSIDKTTTQLNAIYDWYFDDGNPPPIIGDDIDSLPKTYPYVVNTISSRAAGWATDPAAYFNASIPQTPGKLSNNTDTYPMCDLNINNANLRGYSIMDFGRAFFKSFPGSTSVQIYAQLSKSAIDSIPSFSPEDLSRSDLICGSPELTTENQIGNVSFPIVGEKDNLIEERDNLINQINALTSNFGNLTDDQKNQLNDYWQQLQQIEQQFNPAPPPPRIIYPEELKPSLTTNIYYLQDEKKVFKLIEATQDDPIETYITALKKGMTGILKIGKVKTENDIMKWAKIIIFDQGIISTYTYQTYPNILLEKDWQKEWAYSILVVDFPQSSNEKIDKFVLGNGNDNEDIKTNKLYKYINLSKAGKIIYCDLTQVVSQRILKELILDQKVKNVIIRQALQEQDFLDEKVKKIKIIIPQLQELNIGTNSTQPITNKSSVVIYNISVYLDNN